MTERTSKGRAIEGESVHVRREGDVRTIILRDTVWKIRVTLEPDTLRLYDADSGTLLFEQDPKKLGINYKDGEFDFGNRDREQLLTAFVIAWIVLHPEH